MLPYLMLVGFPTLLAFVSPYRAAAAVLVPILLFYIAFIGFRVEVGPDWVGYVYMISQMRYLSFEQFVLRAEAGFYLALWTSLTMGWDIYGINVICAVVFCVGAFVFIRRTPEPWISLLVITSFTVPMIAMSGIRQSMALGILYIVIAYWQQLGVLAKLALIGLASLFHFSALIMLAFMGFGDRMSWARRVFAVGVVAAAVGVVINSAGGQIDLYTDRYTSGRGAIATGAAFHVLLNGLPGVFFLLVKRRWEAKFGVNPLLTMMAIGSVLLLPVIPFSSITASRLSLYFTPVSVYVWSGLPQFFALSTASTLLFRGTAVMLNLFVFFFWLNFANVSFAYFPYRSLLFD